MNLEKLHNQLITAARRQPPDERVPYAFEKRMMALIAERSVVDRWAGWTRGLGRAALGCVLVAVVCTAVSLLLPLSAGNRTDLSQDFENTLLASVEPGDDLASLP